MLSTTRSKDGPSLAEVLSPVSAVPLMSPSTPSGRQTAHAPFVQSRTSKFKTAGNIKMNAWNATGKCTEHTRLLWRTYKELMSMMYIVESCATLSLMQVNWILDLLKGIIINVPPLWYPHSCTGYSCTTLVLLHCFSCNRCKEPHHIHVNSVRWTAIQSKLHKRKEHMNTCRRFPIPKTTFSWLLSHESDRIARSRKCHNALQIPYLTNRRSILFLVHCQKSINHAGFSCLECVFIGESTYAILWGNMYKTQNDFVPELRGMNVLDKESTKANKNTNLVPRMNSPHRVHTRNPPICLESSLFIRMQTSWCMASSSTVCVGAVL